VKDDRSMTLPLRDFLAYAIALFAFLVAGIRATRVPVRAEASAMNEALARQAYVEITSREGDLRRNAALRFQGSPWSQQDEFHSRERGAIRSFAGAHRVSISSVVNALDRGMREHWPTSANVVVNQKVIPCRPRLAY
jgi:hypothetical protein